MLRRHVGGTVELELHAFCGIHSRALYVKIQEISNECVVLKYNVFTIKTPEL